MATPMMMNSARVSSRVVGLPAGASSSRASRSKRVATVTKAADRELWYPGAVAPKYLDGKMAGDYGFDPLRLGANANLLPYYREAELLNGRWAMTAVVGILFTEAAGLPNFVEAATQDYGISLPVLIGTQVVVMSVLESYRILNFQKTGECSLLLQAPFDPLNKLSDEMRVKELKNGRLAMLAFLGFVSQYAVTGLTPIAAFKAHLADPAGVNIYTSPVGFEVTLAVVAACVAPTIIEAFKTLGDGEDDEFRPIPW